MILLLFVLSLVMSISVAETEKDGPITKEVWGKKKELGMHYGNFKAHENFYLKLDEVWLFFVDLDLSIAFYSSCMHGTEANTVYGSSH